MQAGTPQANGAATPMPPQEAAPEATPLMRQYGALKREAGDALLLFRMGDFYELFGEDAVVASKLLEITLTSRDKGKPNALPMAGVPHHSAQSYIQRLLRAGHRVAIGEQVDEPGPGKALVRREITRVLSPAINLDTENADPQYLAAWVEEDSLASVALLEPTTGELRWLAPEPRETAWSACLAFPVRHWIVLRGIVLRGPVLRGPVVRGPVVREIEPPAGPKPMGAAVLPGVIPAGTVVEELPSNTIGESAARELVVARFGQAALSAGTGLVHGGLAVRALAIAIRHLETSLRREKLDHLRFPTPLRQARGLSIPPAAIRALDLVAEPGEPSVLGVLLGRVGGWTRGPGTSAGARRLRQWLLEPLADQDGIRERQAWINELQVSRKRTAWSTPLGRIADLERIVARAEAGVASPRDALALGLSLGAAGELAATLDAGESRLGKDSAQAIAALADETRELGARLVRDLVDPAPTHARDGGVFRPTCHPELGRLADLAESGHRFLVELEARERSATGIASLKVKYNRVFGYSIEVTSANLASVPSRFHRKQTIAGGERFVTEELKRLEDELLGATERRRALEAELFMELVSALREKTRSLSALASRLADLDAALALADLASAPGWNWPLIDSTRDLELEGSRHPIVEASLRGAFVPNDLRMSEAASALVITGPNMGGKSTLMRQAAIIVALGQMGAPVPASRARWGVVSQLFARIGAQDAIARGQSTFMVEMTELAQILHLADERALVVLDEIGRGTSTFDGISVAWATLESLARRARVLFATHYHELTALERHLPGVVNARMGVSTERGLRFLYRLEAGPANESFGIQVAELAGVPRAVVGRAWEVLAELEQDPEVDRIAGTAQLSLFDGIASPSSAARTPIPRPAPEPEALRELRALDCDRLTPLEALVALARIRELALRG